MKLLIGSQGTLAIITGASFKLFPAPRQTRTFVAEFATFGRGHRVSQSRAALAAIADLPGTGLAGARVPLPAAKHPSAWSIYVRAAGSDAVLARYRAELGTRVSHEIDGQGEQDLWRALSDFSHSFPATSALPSDLVFASSQRSSSQSWRPSAIVSEVERPCARRDRQGGSRSSPGRSMAGQRRVTLVNFLNAASALRNRLSRDASMAVLRCPTGIAAPCYSLGTYADEP